MLEREKCNKVSIYLIKDEVKYDEVLKGYVYKHELQKKENSITYYFPTTANRPTWLIDYFNLDEISDISNSRSQVISLHKLVIDGKERIFAIPFGNGKYLLNDDVIEEQFGIKILLNTVDKNEFRTINIPNYGSDHRTKNEQMPKKTDISNFGFDVHNDFLVYCYKRYNSNKYKENFPWLDNIKEVKEKKLKTELNEKLVEDINNHNSDKIWIAVPEVIDWEKISDFRFKMSKTGEDDIEIISFLDQFDNKKIPNFEVLKSKKVFAMQHDSNEPLEA